MGNMENASLKGSDWGALLEVIAALQNILMMGCGFEGKDFEIYFFTDKKNNNCVYLALHTIEFFFFHDQKWATIFIFNLRYVE